jgi:hypothetical protein
MRFPTIIEGLALGICIFIAYYIPVKAQAAIKWETREKTIKVKLEDPELKTEFAFVNEGKTPVTVLKTITSCGCTTAKLDKTTFAPGEKGSVKVGMILGSHTGDVTKTIYVKTDDDITTTLTLTASIPELMEFQPKLVHWKKGDTQSKVVNINILNKKPVNITHIDAPYGGRVVLTEIEQGRRYELKILYSDSRKARSEPIRLETDFKAGDSMKVLELPQTTEFADDVYADHASIKSSLEELPQTTENNPNVARSGLAWLDTEVEVKASLSDETAKAEFRFENRGKTTVKILDLRRSCGCESARIVGDPTSDGNHAKQSGDADNPPASDKTEKTEFAPGEKGKVEIEIKLAGLTGAVERSVRVKTDENRSPGQSLLIKAIVPKPVEVSPQQLDWIIGREVKSKKILISALEGMKIRPVAIKCRHPEIQAEYKTVEKDKIVELSVVPNDTGGSLLSEVGLTIEVSSGKTTVKKDIAVPVKVDYDW